MGKKLWFFLSVITAATPLARGDDLTATLMLMNNYNMRQDPDVWARVRQGFKLDHEQTKQVVYYEKLYTKNPKTFAKLVNNAKPYIYYILSQTERNGMPSEVALLPGVESTFNPNAKSSSNAYGMWQFVPSTGKRFNLAQNSDIDERQDVVKSTQSALSYLNYLHRIFGQWEPAIGAYNCGEGNMYKEIVHSGQTPGSINYSNLNLREETQNYLPKLIAIASIIENPDKFGVDLGEVENKPFFAVVNPETPTQLSNLVSLSGIDKNTFYQLNPQFKSNSYMLSSKDNIILPLQNQSIYFASIGKSNGALVAPSPVAEELAEAPSVTTSDRLATNNVPVVEGNPNVDMGNAAPDALMVAANGQGNATTNVQGNTTTNAEDKAITNAEDNAITNAEGKALTNNGNATGSAQNVAVHNKLDDLITTLSSSASTNDNGSINYTVTNGDTLYSIAKKFGANVDDIRQQNKIPGDNLNVGQTIIIKTATTTNS